MQSILSIPVLMFESILNVSSCMCFCVCVCSHTTNDEHVEALFSSQHSDADLKELKNRARCLTLGQTIGRLSLQTFPNIQEVR